MAKASWCTVAPMSGTGDADLKISGTSFTGNANRTTKVTVQNQNGTKPSAEVNVTQTAKAQHLTLSKGSVEVDGYDGGKSEDVTVSTNVNFATLNGATYYLGFESSDASGSITDPDAYCSKCSDFEDFYWMDGSTSLMHVSFQDSFTGTGVVKNGVCYYPLAQFLDTTSNIYSAAETTSSKMSWNTGSNRNGWAHLLLMGIYTYNSSTQTYTKVYGLLGCTLSPNSSLSLSASFVTIPTAGTAQTVKLTSNDEWKVE